MEAVPRQFCCPITLEPYKDPVRFGVSIYERTAIVEWLQKNITTTDPLTNLPMYVDPNTISFNFQTEVEIQTRVRMFLVQKELLDKHNEMCISRAQPQHNVAQPSLPQEDVDPLLGLFNTISECFTTISATATTVTSSNTTSTTTTTSESSDSDSSDSSDSSDDEEPVPEDITDTTYLPDVTEQSEEESEDLSDDEDLMEIDVSNTQLSPNNLLAIMPATASDHSHDYLREAHIAKHFAMWGFDTFPEDADGNPTSGLQQLHENVAQWDRQYATTRSGRKFKA